MNSKKKIVIAIDGFSSCGKSTLAKALANELGYIFIDSGAMYRGVALYCSEHNLIPDGTPLQDEIEQELPKISLAFRMNPETKQADLYLNDTNVESRIRTPEIAAVVSKVAAIKSVREKLVLEQRKMGTSGGIVMDGRDIGSVVFPNAELKLFVTATPEIRAERRFKELKEKGIEISFQEVLKNLTERDFLDTTRAESPLIKTKDAIEIDTSNLTREEQLDKVLNLAIQLIENKI
jgi:cytidylate kinase